MAYKATKQFARGEEKLIAEFSVLKEAIFFITKKSSIDADERKKTIYRLYDDNGLLQVVNKENISFTQANYADGNGEFNNTLPFTFQLKISTGNSSESETVAQFYDKNDAYLFVLKLLEADARQDNELLFLFKEKVIMDTLSKSIVANRLEKSDSSLVNEKGSTRHLSPLSTRPTPSGGPPDYWVETDDGDDKD